jgi:uncharacterized cupredoxin-like copper-binding protein
MSLRALLLIPVATATLAGAACSSDTPSGDGDGDGVAATLRDFSIELAQSSAPAGPVAFDITNEGPSVHEFEVLRTDAPADALAVDSGLVQTSADGIEIVDEVEEVAPGAGMQLSVDLDPGSYAIICNLPGHYEAGMFTSFEVR